MVASSACFISGPFVTLPSRTLTPPRPAPTIVGHVSLAKTWNARLISAPIMPAVAPMTRISDHEERRETVFLFAFGDHEKRGAIGSCCGA